MILNLFRTIVKDQKLIFRGWRSVLALIIGPLLIALLITVTFTSSSKYEVNIGLVNSEYIPQALLNNLENSVGVIYYESSDTCLFDTKSQKIHGCLVIEQDQENTRINFYFDKSREMISLFLISSLKGSIQNYVMSSVDPSQLKQIKDTGTQVTGQIEYMKGDLEDSSSEMGTMSINMGSSINSARDDIYTTKADIESQRISVNSKIDDKISDLRTTESRVNNIINMAESIDTYSYPALQSFKNSILNELYTARADTQNAIYELQSMKSDNDNSAVSFNNKLNNFEYKLQEFENQRNSIDSFNNKMYSAISTLSGIEDSMTGVLGFSSLQFKKFDLNEVGIPLAQPDISDFKNLDSIRSIFLVVLIIIIVFISLVFSNILYKNEINSPAYIRWKLSTTPVWINTLGVLVSTTFIVMIQIGVLLFAGNRIFYLNYGYNTLPIILILCLNILLFGSIGIIISHLIKNEGISLLTTLFIAISVYIFSGFILPIERMGFLMAVSNHMPNVLTLDILRKLIFYGVHISFSYYQMGILALQCLVCVLFALVISQFKQTS
jgi:hypothetical protein